MTFCKKTQPAAFNKSENAFALIGLAVLSLFFAAQSEDYTTWTNHKKIYINTAVAGVTGQVTKFPVLIRLSSSNFGGFKQARAGGLDVRFSKADPTQHLAYEIERWDSANAVAEVWVNVDTVFGNNTSQYIVMHYGQAGAADSSKSMAVFDTANGFQGVWHFKEATGALAMDATGNHYNGTASGTVKPQDTAGPIGRAKAYDGASSNFEMLNTATSKLNFQQDSFCTFSAWVLIDSINGEGQSICNKGNGQYNLQLTAGNPGKFQVVNYLDSTGWSSSEVPVTTKVWTYVSGVQLGASKSICGAFNSSTTYVDSTQILYNVKYPRNFTNNFGVGKIINGGGYLVGKADEVRIESKARSKDWVKLSYETQKPNGSTLCLPPGIALQPSAVAVNIGDTAAFRVKAGISGAAFKWQKSTDGGTSWSDATAGIGATDTLYKFKTVTADTNTRLRCIVSTCSADTSQSALLTVYLPPTVTGPADTTVYVGDNAYFSVVASGSSLTYQWEKSTNAGTTWNHATAGNGATTASYHFKTDSSNINCLFHCVVTGGVSSLSTTSRAAVLSLCYHVTADAAKPADQSVTAGQPVSFSVSASGKNLSYSWQRQNPGAGTWDSIAGAHGASYTFTCSSADNGASFRCQIGSACDAMLSRVALLGVCTPPAIDSQPSNTNVQVGQTATFRIVASGTGLTYQWERSNNAGLAWGVITGATASVYSFSTAISDTGSSVQFHCIASGSCGSVTSAIAQVGLCFPPVIAVQPHDTETLAGRTASFSVIASGTTLSYQWERQDRGGSWGPVAGASGASYTTPVLAPGDSGESFHCLITGACGGTDTSGLAALRVWTAIAIASSGQPLNASATGGDTASFQVTASGTAPQYQWQRSRNGGAWDSIAGATASLCKVKTDTADTGALFRCIVSNKYNSVTSSSASLTLCYPVKITSNPANALNVAAGEQAIFSVTATGVSLHYQWQKNTSGSTWADLPGATSPQYSVTVATGDSLSHYQCKVGTLCTDTVSGEATLTVCALPAITKDAAGTTVIEGQPARFFVSATGTGLAYLWQHQSRSTGTWDSVGGDSVLNIVTTSSDSGTLVRCIVKGSCGSATGTGALLAVYGKVRVNFIPNSAVGTSPDTVVFSDSSSGNIAQWHWSYGDGAIDSGAPPKTHIYAATGVYTVKLAASGPGGSDSATKTVRVYSLGGNPIVLAGRFLGGDTVVLSVSNYDSLKDAAPAPYVDSIKLFSRSDALPDSLNAKFVKTYALSSLKARGGTYLDTVKVGPLVPADSLYGFMTQIRWNDGARTPFTAVNGTMVTMRDTTHPANPLALYAAYLRFDTVSFYLDSVQKIDTLKADSVALWYGVGPTDTVPGFVLGAAQVKWWSAREIVKGATSGRFTYRVQSGAFNTETTPLAAAVVVQGKNRLRSPIVKTSTTVGRARPQNPIVLHAVSQGANSIRLNWQALHATDSVSRIRIYYRAGSALPLEYDFSTLKVDSVTPEPAALDSLAAVLQLAVNTRYYFGAQVFKQGLWSRLTAASCADDSTALAASIKNTIKMSRNGGFDTSTNKLWVYWTVDTTVGSNLQVGVSYSTQLGAQADTSIHQFPISAKARDSVAVALREPLLFNQDYYVSLWLRRGTEPWVAPTTQAVTVIHVPGFVWQAVQCPVDTAKLDTSFWVNGAIRIVTYPSPTQVQFAGTLRQYTVDAPKLAGFITVGSSVVFSEYAQSDSISIGIKSTGVPSPYRLQDARLYRYDSSCGCWFVERGSAFDTAASYVYDKTNALGKPFALLIDTAAPTLHLLSVFDTVIGKGIQAYDTVQVTDNVGNVRWQFHSAKGGEPYAPGDTRPEQDSDKRKRYG